MPSIPVGLLLAAMAVAGGYYGGKAAYKHVVKPTGCAIEKVATFGHKHCKPKAKPTPSPTPEPATQE